MAAKDGSKTGGRQKGVPNRKTAEQADAVSNSGITPLGYMISVMRDENNAADIRLDAAKSAAPYVHPKLATVQVKGDEDSPIRHVHTIDAFTSRISRLAARAGEDEGDRDAH